MSRSRHPLGGMGYRARSELTDRQLEELKWRDRLNSRTIMLDGHHRRTVRSLVAKGYMRWTLPAELEAEITDEGRARVRGVDPTRSRPGS